MDFYKKSSLQKSVMDFGAYENFPRCGNEPNNHSNIYGTYRVLKNKTLELEITEEIPAPEGVSVDMSAPSKTKAQKYYFEIIKKGKKISFIKFE